MGLSHLSLPLSELSYCYHCHNLFPFSFVTVRVILLHLLQSFPLFICHCQGHIVTFVTVFSPFHLSLSGSYCYICYSLFPFSFVTVRVIFFLSYIFSQSFQADAQKFW